MEVQIPVKNLQRLNWLLISTSSAIVFLFFFFLLEESELHKFFYTALTAIGIGLVGYANIGILVMLARRYSIESKKFKWYRYIASYAGAVAIYLGLSPVFGYFTWDKYSLGMFVAMFSSAGVIINTMTIFFQDFVILQNSKAQAEMEFAKMKAAHAEAANLLLKQQVHPHFLFNALNTVKSLYRKDPRAGDIYIVHLANFLRASVFSHASKLSKVEDELALLCDYLEMQKIRFGAALECNVALPPEILKAYYLPSFSLQPLLENAIKHNELTEEAPLKVCISYADGWITVRNNLQKRTWNVVSANHGLANLAERYRLLSGDKVIIKEDPHTFSVGIKLLNDEYSDH